MTSRKGSPRKGLTREIVLRAAMELVDREGLEALTMRRLGAELDVEAMSLYKHVINKDDVLNGIVALVVSEMRVPDTATWRDAMRGRAIATRQALSGHSWAIGLIESRGLQGAGVAHHLDDTLGRLRSAGFSVEDSAHSIWLLDSFVYGHVVQEASNRGDASANDLESDAIAELHHLAELLTQAETFNYSFEDEFNRGLELVLDGIEQIYAP